MGLALIFGHFGFCLGFGEETCDESEMKTVQYCGGEGTFIYSMHINYGGKYGKILSFLRDRARGSCFFNFVYNLFFF